jgi:ABC-type dipeptide/oligopeptide/nickel transport system permease subunit
MKPADNQQLRIGLLLLSLVLTGLLLSLLLNGVRIDLQLHHRLENSSSSFVLGTDELGRDLLSCITCGTAISLLISLVVISLTAVTGTAVGMAAGLSGGMADTVLMRLTDFVLSFPGILLVIALVSFLGQGFFNLILAFSCTGWAGTARMVRGIVIAQRQKEFILAARSYNASPYRIAIHHLLPIVYPLVIVQATMGISAVIVAESSLNFLGLGLDPRIPTLGQLIDAGRGHLFDRPQLVILPGAVLALLIMAFHFLGEGLRGLQKE